MTMNRQRLFWSLAIPVFLLIGSVPPSWGWRGGGWGGPRVGVYVGPGPWWYGPNYYDPYYGDTPYYYPTAYYPYYPYNPGYVPAPAPAAEAPQEETRASPDNSRHDLIFLNSQIARARDQVDYEYDDGDISRAEHSAEIHRLSQITKAAHAAAKANGGYLTGDQEDSFMRQLRGEEAPAENSGGSNGLEDRGRTEPEAPPAVSGRSLQKVSGEISRLRALLDKKLADGDITKAQQDGMNRYLNQIDQHIHSDAAANNGTLTPDQESAALQQLRRSEESITQNFIQP